MSTGKAAPSSSVFPSLSNLRAPLSRPRLSAGRLAGGLLLAGLLVLAGCGGSGGAGTAAPAGLVKAGGASETHTGTWWNAAESGTGFLFEHQGSVAVASFFVYDDAGRPVWYSSAGTYSQNPDGSGSYSAVLQYYTGGQPAHSSTYKAPTSSAAGNVAIRFASAGTATVELPGRTLQATRFRFAEGGTPPGRPETGIYWNPQESGRGYIIDMQGSIAALTMFHYADDGRPTWNTVTADLSSGTATADFMAYSGGQTLNGPYKPPAAPQSQGRFTLRFSEACRGRVQLEGMPVVNIVRFPFGGLPAGAECRSGPSTRSINDTTSYVHQNQQEDFNIGAIVNAAAPGYFYDARVFADLDGDGVKELVVAPGRGDGNGVAARVYRSEGGSYTDATSSFFQGGVPSLVHPRKTLAADFNGDGRLDLYFADHGFDQPPFPGAPNVLALSGAGGKLSIKAVPGGRSQYHHCAAAGDIDNNGTVDIIACGSSWQAANGSKSAYRLLNDGQGNMTVSASGLPDSLIRNSNLTALELVDVDGDGLLDLLIADSSFNSAQQRDERRAIVYWGNGSGTFAEARSMSLPLNGAFPVVYDFKAEDIDGDNTRDLVLLSLPLNSNGYYVHIFRRTGPRQYADESLSRIVKDAASWEGIGKPWFPWLRMSDINGDGHIDIGIGDASSQMVRRNIRWLNDGTGKFIRQ
jgi:hypothetical protein